MPLTENGACRKVARSLDQLATPGSKAERAFLAAVRAELKPEIRKMYETSSDPFGSAWTVDKDGRPAYQSKKMANAIGIKRVDGGLSVREWVKWIRAADEGHTWPARQAKAGVSLFDTKGHFLSGRRGRSMLGSAYRGRSIVVADGNSSRFYRNRVDKETKSRYAELVGKSRAFAAHTVGARTLPPRRQQPGGRMPDAWGEAINRGALKGMTDFMARVTGNGG